jgi:hypothetical protein
MNKRGPEINVHLTNDQKAWSQATACASAVLLVTPEDFVAVGEKDTQGHCGTLVSCFLLLGTLISIKSCGPTDIAFTHIPFLQSQCIVTETYDLWILMWPPDRKVEHQVK